MSRIRSVHPGFFTDEELVSVSMAARLLFIGVGIEADDKGVFEWKPLTLKMKIFPADNLDVSELLLELLNVNAICQYKMDGKTYGAIRNFRRFQKPKTPNDVHPATPEIRIYVGLSQPVSETDDDDETKFPPKGEKSVQMEEGGGRREEETHSNECEGGAPDFRLELAEPEPPPSLKPEHFVEVWNETAVRIGRPSIRDLTPERRQQLKARINGHSIEDFRLVLGKIEASAFLRGEKAWSGATFDWLIKKSNFQKVLEGNYDA